MLIPAVSLAGPSCRCKQQSVVGTYAVAAEGTMTMTLEDGTQAPAPVAGLSIATIDPEGDVSAAGYMVVGGVAQYSPLTPGTITVNTDCTGEIAWKNDEGEIFTAGELIVQKGGSEITSIMTQSGLGTPTVTGRWKKISWVPYNSHNHSPVCSPLCTRGTYVAHQRGINIIPEVGPVPGAFLGRTSIYYNDTVEMSGTGMIAGTKMPFTLANGVWEEGELECTGTITGDIMAGGVQYMGQVESWFVVLDGGSELWGIALEDPTGNPVALLTLKRSSWWPTSFE